MLQLKNESLEISFTTKGAELTSVKNTSGLEFMWQAQADVWPRHAPVLFPIVGRLRNDSYQFEQNSYSLPQHGFARDLEFDVKHHSDDKLVFELKDNVHTRKKYPFSFSFSIEYRLHQNELQITYLTQNTGNTALLYSVGAHPGFRCPLLPTETYNDYYLKFESGSFETTVLQDGLLSPQKETLKLENGVLDLSYSLFDKDALVFENAQISQVTLCSKKSEHKIQINCRNWPFFGIWSKKGGADFVCLEPWYGIADAADSAGHFEAKKGIRSLQAGQSEVLRYSLSFQ